MMVQTALHKSVSQFFTCFNTTREYLSCSGTCSQCFLSKAITACSRNLQPSANRRTASSCVLLLVINIGTYDGRRISNQSPFLQSCTKSNSEKYPDRILGNTCPFSAAVGFLTCAKNSTRSDFT